MTRRLVRLLPLLAVALTAHVSDKPPFPDVWGKVFYVTILYPYTLLKIDPIR